MIAWFGKYMYMVSSTLVMSKMLSITHTDSRYTSAAISPISPYIKSFIGA